MKLLLKHLLATSVVLLSNAYCTNNNNNALQINDSSNFDTNYLQNVVQDSNNMIYDEKNSKYCIFDRQSSKYIIFSSQQLSNTFNEILTNTDEKIINTSVVKAKFSIAEPFYRIMYNPQKLSFLFKNNDLNIFKTINNIVNKLKPLCKEYTISNLGPKSILYGIQTLEGTLPTINNQFINGLNFQIDFTRPSSCNLIDCVKYYSEMLIKVPTLNKCIDYTLLNELVTNTDDYINTMNRFKDRINNNPNYSLSNNDKNNNIIRAIDEKISIVRNLHDFFKINKNYIFKNIIQISLNLNNIFRELLHKQSDEIEINELLNQFFNKLENINNFPENEKQEILNAFEENIFFNKFLNLILLIKDNKTINKINYFLNVNDIKFNMHNFFAYFANQIWSTGMYDGIIEEKLATIDELNEDELIDMLNLEKLIQGTSIEKKLEMYYKRWLMFCNNFIQLHINPDIDSIKKNKNNNIKELKNTMLEYLLKMKSYLLDEAKKCAIFFDNKQSLVPNNFWKQKQIDFKNY